MSSSVRSSPTSPILSPTPTSPHPSSLDPREPPPPPASASDIRHPHPHPHSPTPIAAVPAGRLVGRSASLRSRSRRTSGSPAPGTGDGAGRNPRSPTRSPLGSPHHSRSASPIGGFPDHSHSHPHTSYPTNTNRVRDDFIGVITPQSGAGVSPGGSRGATPRGSFGAGAGSGRMSPSPLAGIEEKIRQSLSLDKEKGDHKSSPLAEGSAVDTTGDEIRSDSDGARSVSPTLDVPRGSAELPNSPTSSIHSAGGKGLTAEGAGVGQTLGEAGKEMLSPSSGLSVIGEGASGRASRGSGSVSPPPFLGQSAVGTAGSGSGSGTVPTVSTTASPIQPIKRPSTPSIAQTFLQSPGQPSSNMTPASAIFERDIESHLPLLPTPPGGSQRAGRASTSSSVPGSPNPTRATPVPAQGSAHIPHHPPYMHDSSDKHVPTVLDDAIEALTSGSGAALEIEAPLHAYHTSSTGMRSPMRSPSPGPGVGLGMGMGSGGQRSPLAVSPLGSPSREQVQDGPHVLSLNDTIEPEDNRDDSQEETSTVPIKPVRPAMDSRQSSMGALFPGAFPRSSNGTDAGIKEKADRTWKKKMEDWIGPKPTAFLGLKGSERDEGKAAGKEETGTEKDKVEGVDEKTPKTLAELLASGVDMRNTKSDGGDGAEAPTTIDQPPPNPTASTPASPTATHNPRFPSTYSSNLYQDKRRISFYTYNDMLQSVPTSVERLSDITSGNVEPDHLPGQLGSAVSSPARSRAVSARGRSGRETSPFAGDRSHLHPGGAGYSSMKRGSAPDLPFLHEQASHRAGLPGRQARMSADPANSTLSQRTSFEYRANEWEREGLGKGLEARLQLLAEGRS